MIPTPGTVLTLAVDFDGTLVEHDVMPLRWRPGAKAFLLGAAAAGAKIWLHSCRAAAACIFDRVMPGDADEFWRSGRVQEDVAISWRLLSEMRAFLEAEGVWGLVQVWALPGKPIAWHYIDDLAELPDWPRIAAELGVQLPVVNSTHADQRGATPLVPAPGIPSGPIASAGAAGPSVAPVVATSPGGVGVQT